MRWCRRPKPPALEVGREVLENSRPPPREHAWAGRIPERSHGGGELRRINAGPRCIANGKMGASTTSASTSARKPGMMPFIGSVVRLDRTDKSGAYVCDTE